jgi:hypothetical protein
MTTPVFGNGSRRTARNELKRDIGGLIKKSGRELCAIDLIPAAGSAPDVDTGDEGSLRVPSVMATSAFGCRPGFDSSDNHQQDQAVI